ncbi:unnamed protein product [Lactuca saligna]|uniref:Uncharacterized protein n=1 Tax=Lactuca saligna TaxID=75948 RepID=A0AA35YRT1_LACSI|nr:unnamed protein product [Lactuca saligna]
MKKPHLLRTVTVLFSLFSPSVLDQCLITHHSLLSKQYSDSMEENQAFPKVDVHYNGANEFVFSDFIKYVEKLIDFQCKHVYFYIPEVRLSERLQTLQNECDYFEFLEVANAHRHLDVYIDHNNEPIFEWIQKEEPDDEELVYSKEDVNSVLADDENCEHEEDGFVISSKRIFKRAYNDKFLNKLCPVIVVD